METKIEKFQTVLYTIMNFCKKKNIYAFQKFYFIISAIYKQLDVNSIFHLVKMLYSIAYSCYMLNFNFPRLEVNRSQDNTISSCQIQFLFLV